MNTEKSNNQYLALTIGPVIKTLLEARKTRELWAASYLLSTLMKYLTENLDPDGKHLLIPKIPDEVKKATLYGAGIYPDRLFMEADGWTEEQINAEIDKSLNSLSKDCLLKEEAGEVNAAAAFWKQFFRIRYALIPLEDIQEGKLSIELSPFLDTLELEDTCMSNEPKKGYDFLDKLFADIFSTDLVKGLRGDNRGSYSEILTKSALFPATHEFASFGLFEQEPKLYLQLNKDTKEDENEKFYQEIETNEIYKPLKKHFKPRHKYFCIVQADGDNIGKAIQQLNDVEQYGKFSETLANYGKEAAEIIDEYGGKPVYIGGDDLLFLAPVRSAKGSVFDLMHALDQKFPKDDLHPTASLSFGLNIVYYKFPLFEAISDAYGILKKAKDYCGKDAVSFRFTKHSGNYFEGVFSKTMLQEIAAASNAFESERHDERAKMVSSLIFKLATLEKLIESVAKSTENNADEFKERLANLFNSFFNEWGEDSEFARQREATEKLLLQAFREKDAIGENWLKLFYAAMRLIQFIVSPSETNQYDTENIAATAG